ncbi:MAG: GTPase [Candidatus Micrarchaeota archaeon]
MKGREKGNMNPWSFLKNMIHSADVIIEVVDARDIKGTRLTLAEKWAGSKRLLLVANKSDLLPKDMELPKLENKGIFISAKDTDERSRIIKAILSRTSKRPVRAILVGYPNVGKSTLVNMLAQRKAAKVSAVAGTTKNLQWINITPELSITDYRGIFPKYEKKNELVRKGALNVQGNEDLYAYDFAEKILKSNELKKWLEEKYDISLENVSDSQGVLEKIAERRRWYIKGGELNLQEAARSLIRAMMEAPEM